jgi:hypothetical protein
LIFFRFPPSAAEVTNLLWYFCKFTIAPPPILHRCSQGQGDYGDCGGGWWIQLHSSNIFVVVLLQIQCSADSHSPSGTRWLWWLRRWMMNTATCKRAPLAALQIHCNAESWSLTHDSFLRSEDIVVSFPFVLTNFIFIFSIWISLFF